MVVNEKGIDGLLTHFRRNRDRVVTFSSIYDKMGSNRNSVEKELDTLVDDGEIYRIGDDRFIFSSNTGLVAFEIFRNIAPHITYEEFLKYRDEEHVLVRMSRDREMFSAPLAEEEDSLPERRGNELR